MLRRLLLSVCLIPSLAFADSKADWQLLRTKDADVDERWFAAQRILERAEEEKKCGRAVQELLEFIVKSGPPVYVATRIADAMPRWCNDPDTIKFVTSRIGQGKAEERAWTLHVARGLASPDLDKALFTKGLADDDERNARAVIQILVDHKYASAVPFMRGLLDSGRRPDIHTALVAGITEMQRATPAWTDWQVRLEQLASNKDDDLRRSALAALSPANDPAHFELFLGALSHPDWSTRALALAFLERSGSKKAVGAIIDRMRNELPDTRVLSECCSCLERLSGMNFGEKVEDWATWWRNSEATFEFPKSLPTERVGGKRPRADSRTYVPPEFYGIDVDSQRVCFVIDVSGSMLQKPKEAGETGSTRVEVAKRELDKMIDSLPPEARFNIVSFGSDVRTWIDSLDQMASLAGDGTSKGKSGGARREEAKVQKQLSETVRALAHAHVAGLKAEGGTNIYDALEVAFRDPEVDTIFFMTDGTPTDGHEIDPARIRKSVQAWNASRRIRLNTIAIGTRGALSRQLATDSGGEYRFRE